MESLIPNYKFFLSLPYYIWVMPIIKIINIDKKDIIPEFVVIFYVLFPLNILSLSFIYGMSTLNVYLILFSVISFTWFVAGGKCVALNSRIVGNEDIVDHLSENTILLFRRYKAFLWSKIRGKKFVRFDFIQDSYITNDGIILKQGWIMKDAKCIKRLKKYEN